MKIHIAKYEPDRQGGGWSFMRNFAKGMGADADSGFSEADIYFICSPSMVQREDVEGAKKAGKKIVLRIDNAVRNSRNRNTGMTRMKDFSDWADLVIYQSQWAKDYLMPFLKKDGPVILNGVDKSLYTGEAKIGDNILYSRYNRDETKNWEVARYWFSQYFITHPESKLYITGQFSQELRDGNFDFYNGENFEYLGVLDDRSMAKVYNICGKFLYTYFNDCCSNSLIEALSAGCEVVGDEYYRNTGGAPEIIDRYERSGRNALSLERMCKEYKSVLEAL